GDVRPLRRVGHDGDAARVLHGVVEGCAVHRLHVVEARAEPVRVVKAGAGGEGDVHLVDAVHRAGRGGDGLARDVHRAVRVVRIVGVGQAQAAGAAVVDHAHPVVVVDI